MVDSLIGLFDLFCFALLGFDWLIYSLIHWLVDWLMHCLFDRLNGLIWFDRFVCLIDGLVGRLNLVWFRVVGCLIDWLFGWFVDFILCGLVGWVFDCLVPWLIPLARYSLLSDWLVNLTLLFCVGLIGRLFAWWNGWFSLLFIDCLTHWLFSVFPLLCFDLIDRSSFGLIDWWIELVGWLVDWINLAWVIVCWIVWCHSIWLVVWLLGLLFDWFVDVFGWLFDWLVGLSWLICCGCLRNWLLDWLMACFCFIGCSVVDLVDVIDCLICLIDWLSGCFIGWCFNWLVDCFAWRGLTWSIDRLVCFFLLFVLLVGYAFVGWCVVWFELPWLIG